MSAYDDGGLAYPLAVPDDAAGSWCGPLEQRGMTMRQAYKIAAMQGFLSHEQIGATALAYAAGRYADAMIEEDKKASK